MCLCDFIQEMGVTWEKEKRKKYSIYQADVDTKLRLEKRVKDGNILLWLAGGGTPLCPSRYVSSSHHGKAILSQL